MGLLGAHEGRLGAVLGPSWALLGPSWGHLGPSWGPPGALLGPSWALVEPLWRSEGESQKSSKNYCFSMNLASRSLSGGVLRASGALPDASRAMLEHLGSLFDYRGGLVEASGASGTVSEAVLGPPGGSGGGLEKVGRPPGPGPGRRLYNIHQRSRKSNHRSGFALDSSRFAATRPDTLRSCSKGLERQIVGTVFARLEAFLRPACGVLEPSSASLELPRRFLRRIIKNRGKPWKT